MKTIITLVLILVAGNANAGILNDTIDCHIALGSEIMYAAKQEDKRLLIGLSNRQAAVTKALLALGADGGDKYQARVQARTKGALKTIKKVGPGRYAEIGYSVCRRLGY